MVVPPPTALTAIPLDSGIILNWTSSTGNNVAGYNVYSGPSATGPFTKLNTDPLTDAPPYTDAKAATGVATYYEVTAVDTSGNESAPAIGNATRGGTGTTGGGGGVGGTTGGGGTAQGVAFDLQRVQNGKAKLASDTTARNATLKADRAALRTVTLADNALIRADKAKLKADKADPSASAADKLQLAADTLQVKGDVATAKAKLKSDTLAYNKLLAADKAEIRAGTRQLRLDQKLLRKQQQKKK